MKIGWLGVSVAANVRFSRVLSQRCGKSIREKGVEMNRLAKTYANSTRNAQARS